MDNQSLNIFVTGATGFIGHAFLDALIETKLCIETIFVLARAPIVFTDPRIRVLHGSLECITDFSKELELSDYVFHIGAKAVYGNGGDYDTVNFHPVCRMVEILRESTRIKNFVFISTIGALDRKKDDTCETAISPGSDSGATSSYGKSKWKAEEYIRAQNQVPYTIIRPAWVYGAGMRLESHISTFVTKAAAKSPLLNLAFQGKISTIHVQDLVRSMLRTIGNPGIRYRTYIGATEVVTLGEMFRIISTEVNQRRLFQIKIPRLPSLLAYLHRWLPLSIRCALFDYLWASDDAYINDFELSEPLKFKEGVKEMIRLHPSTWKGYWIVTGANSGIGWCLAQLLVKRKERVILIDRDTDRLMQLSKSDDCVVFQCNLGDAKEVELLCSRLSSYRIFALVNNAGIGIAGDICEVSLAQIEQMIRVNYLAPVYLTKGLIAGLVQNRSTIVNISSSVAFNPLPKMAFYSASKAALSNWSESLNYELRKTNRVITIAPSGTNTAFQAKAGVRVFDSGKTLLSPEWVANQIYRSVFRSKAVVVLGGSTKVLLAISRLLPRKINIHLWGKLFEITRNNLSGQKA